MHDLRSAAVVAIPLVDPYPLQPDRAGRRDRLRAAGHRDASPLLRPRRRGDRLWLVGGRRRCRGPDGDDRAGAGRSRTSQGDGPGRGTAGGPSATGTPAFLRTASSACWRMSPGASWDRTEESTERLALRGDDQFTKRTMSRRGAPLFGRVSRRASQGSSRSLTRGHGRKAVTTHVPSPLMREARALARKRRSDIGSRPRGHIGVASRRRQQPYHASGQNGHPVISAEERRRRLNHCQAHEACRGSRAHQAHARVVMAAKDLNPDDDGREHVPDVRTKPMTPSLSQYQRMAM